MNDFIVLWCKSVFLLHEKKARLYFYCATFLRRFILVHYYESVLFVCLNYVLCTKLRICSCMNVMCFVITL